jgi:hypothetical protein
VVPGTSQCLPASFGSGAVECEGEVGEEGTPDVRAQGLKALGANLTAPVLTASTSHADTVT